MQISVGAEGRGDGGKARRHAGMVAIFPHLNMHMLLIEDKGCMLSGVRPKLMDMRKRVKYISSVGCIGSDATNRQQQDNNKYDNDGVTDWNDVVSCADDGFGGGEPEEEDPEETSGLGLFVVCVSQCWSRI